MSRRAEIRTKKLGLSALLLILSIAAGAETLTGTVVGVADGGTVTLLVEHTVSSNGKAFTLFSHALKVLLRMQHYARVMPIGSR